MEQNNKIVENSTWLPNTLGEKENDLVQSVATALGWEVDKAGAFCVALLEEVNAHEEANTLNRVLNGDLGGLGESTQLDEKSESDPSLKPPKEWFDKMEKEIKKSNPDYSDEQVKKTIGSIWYKQLDTKKKKELRGREGKTYGKSNEDIETYKIKEKHRSSHNYHLKLKDQHKKLSQAEKDANKKKYHDAQAKRHEYMASMYESRLNESEFYHTKALNSYLETMLWSTNDNSDEKGGEPLDKNYDISDIAPELIEQSKKDITAFYEKAGDTLDRYDDKQIGHDFWLTRNRHGAGFWDGDYEEVEGDGDKLTEIAQEFGEVDPYVGDDGKIYA